MGARQQAMEYLQLLGRHEAHMPVEVQPRLREGPLQPRLQEIRQTFWSLSKEYQLRSVDLAGDLSQNAVVLYLVLKGGA